MAGMKFLNLKGWHPSNARNQKRIWIAEQQAKEKEQRERDAAAEVKKSAEEQSFQLLAAAKGDEESARRVEKQQVGFLYAPPPGLQKMDAQTAQDGGEDDAVREFRRKVEKRSGGLSTADLQRPLERYVGRRPDEMLTIKEQVERFPMLKDAPVEGDYAANVKVNFKPMGVQLRNVRCLRCNEWGHQSGDRECQLRDFNPHDAARQAREDPMTYIAQMNSARKNDLVLKKTALPLEMQRDGNAKPEYEILLSDGEASDPEKQFLASLSTKEKKRLLKQLRKQTEESDNSSSSGSESSNDDRRRRKHKRKHSHKKRSKKSTKREKREHSDGESHGRSKDRDAHRTRQRASRSYSPEARPRRRDRERCASPQHRSASTRDRRERSRSRDRRR